MFTAHKTIRMYDTDSAQILFFGSQFRLINDVFEDLLASIGLTMDKLFRELDYAFVVRHAQSDYLAPSRVGDKIKIEATITHIGQSSFEVSYTLFNTTANRLIGKSKTVHVVIDKETTTKKDIPETLREALKTFKS